WLPPRIADAGKTTTCSSFKFEQAVALLDAKGVALGVAHDGPRFLVGAGRSRLLFDDGGSEPRESLDFRVALFGPQIQVDRDLRRSRLLATVEEQARAAAALGMRERDVRVELRRVEPRGQELVPAATLLPLIAERLGPEGGEPLRVGAGECDVADERPRRGALRVRPLHAEAVSLRIAHDCPALA